MSSDGSSYCSDGSDESGVEVGQFIMRLCNRTPWILYHSVLASLRDYLDAVTWPKFVARETSTVIVEAEPDADVAQRSRALIASGMLCSRQLRYRRHHLYHRYHRYNL